MKKPVLLLLVESMDGEVPHEDRTGTAPLVRRAPLAMIGCVPLLRMTWLLPFKFINAIAALLAAFDELKGALFGPTTMLPPPEIVAAKALMPAME